MRSIHANCRASTSQPVFSTLKSISISHLARYQSISSTRLSRPAGMRLVSSHSIGLRLDFLGDHARYGKPTSQCHSLHAQRLFHRACPLVRAGRHGKLDFTHRLGLEHLPSELLVAVQTATAGRADQPVRRRSEHIGALHQLRDIRFSIGHVHQPCARQRRSDFDYPLVAFDPARALFDAAPIALRILRLACSHPGIQYAQPHVIRTDRIRRVQVHAAPDFGVQRTQATDLLTVEVQFRRFLDAQHHRMLAHSLLCALPVRPQNAAPLERRVLHETVGSHRLRPPVARMRNARRRLLGQSRQQRLRASRLATPRFAPSSSLCGHPSDARAICPHRKLRVNADSLSITTLTIASNRPPAQCPHGFVDLCITR